MTLDVVGEERVDAQRWLYRCDNSTPFAYAHREHFIRYADQRRWAHLRGDRLFSVRSGECLAYRVGNIFYDSSSREPVYYEPASGARGAFAP